MIIDLSGKTAIVTGSTGGIGLAIARGLADAGATVVVCGHSVFVSTPDQAMLSTIPPSTRSAAPVVALACGEAA